MTKSRAILGSLAFVAGVLTPPALAHTDLTPWAYDGQLGPNQPTSPANGYDRVSGVYYGDVSLLAGLASDCFLTDCKICILSDYCDQTTIDTDPSFLLGFGGANAYCDWEVVGPGDGQGDYLDEPEVDGSSNAASSLGRTLFNDGGIGGVCHHHQGYYGNEQYNTPGCGSAYTNPAYGYDSTAPDVWLTTQCAYAHSISGSVGMGRYVMTCVRDNVRTNDLGGEATCGANVIGCAASGPTACLGIDEYQRDHPRDCGRSLRVLFLYPDSCLLETTICTALLDLDMCPVVDGYSCGPDAGGSADVSTPGMMGWGSYGVPFESVPPELWSHDGNYDWWYEYCEEADGAASVWVWTAAFVDSITLTVDVSVPTVGVIY